MIRLHPNLDQPQPLRRCDWPACGAACCYQGVWVDEAEIADILAHARLIAPHMRAEDQNAALWFRPHREPDPHALSGWVRPTEIRADPAHYQGTRCIFLRADFKCALQVAAEAQGLHPWRWKPFYCILHPLDMDEEGRIKLPPVDELLAEPAACVRPARQVQRPREIFAAELAYLAGEKISGPRRSPAAAELSSPKKSTAEPR